MKRSSLLITFGFIILTILVVVGCNLHVRTPAWYVDWAKDGSTNSK